MRRGRRGRRGRRIPWLLLRLHWRFCSFSGGGGCLLLLYMVHGTFPSLVAGASCLCFFYRCHDHFRRFHVLFDYCSPPDREGAHFVVLLNQLCSRAPQAHLRVQWNAPFFANVLDVIARCPENFWPPAFAPRLKVPSFCVYVQPPERAV